MSITSLVFFGASILAVLIYWRLPGRFRLPWLLAVSIGFLLTWSWLLAAVLLVAATVNFLLGRWLGRAESARRTLLLIGIGFDLVLLIGLKYFDFFAVSLETWLARLGISAAAGGQGWLVTIGLSFITLQLISYLVDVYHGILAPETSWPDFALYVLYFPKLLSGPIERARRLLPELKQPKPLDIAAVERSFWLIVTGLVRKVILADTLTRLIPTDIFVHPAAYPGQLELVYLLAYALALYNDFAGYTGIVRGVSGFFGIELSSNFELPYLARNFTEFWTRWHISLSTWLRDYIYFPLSRALLRKFPRREQLLNLAFPPLATMLVSGLWHGLGWNYLAWGGLYGVYLIGERLLTLRGARQVPDEWPKWRQVLAVPGVFALVVLAWIPFRMTLPVAWQFFLRLFSASAWAGLPAASLAAILGGRIPATEWGKLGFPDLRVFPVMLLAILVDWAQLRAKNETVFVHWPGWAKAAFLAVLLLAFSLLAFTEAGAPFVYQGF